MTVDEATVTSPPPELLNTTLPLVVATGVAPLGVVGATTCDVGGSLEDAVIFEAAEVVVLLLPPRFANLIRLLASAGFSEWRCSMAERSLLNTPSWNLGEMKCRTE